MSSAEQLDQHDDGMSWATRLRYTPMRDLLRGELTGRLSLAYVIAHSDLPTPLVRIVRSVVRRTRLWRREKREVARELIAHFRDGLAGGATPESLAVDFGDVDRAAVLIRRAKKRNRPIYWRAGKRVLQGMALLILIYAVMAARFFLGRPSISHHYLDDLNRTAASFPADQRAWPLYRQALTHLLPRDPIFTAKDAPHPGAVKPGDPHWPAFSGYVASRSQALALVREAAGKPALGFMAAARLSPEDRALWPADDPRYSESLDPNPPLYEVLLPYLGEMRQLAFLLVIDARMASEAGDAERVLDDMNAIMGMVRQVRQTPLIINDLVALALFQLMLDRVGEFVHTQPQLFADAQLQRLAHQIAAFTDRDFAIEFTGERMMFEDFLQRFFTDDGSGDGHVTLEGLRMLDSMISLGGSLIGPNHSKGWVMPAAPAMNAVMLSRRDMQREHARLMDKIEAYSRLPLWQQHGHADDDLERWHASPLERMRHLPLVYLLPALSKAGVNKELVLQSRDGILAAIAVQMHHRRQGTWPATLDDLVPHLLPRVPPDRFDGKPLKYALINGEPVLYSVGTDRDDDGGKPPTHVDGRPAPQEARRWWGGPVPPSLQPQIDGDWILWPAVE